MKTVKLRNLNKGVRIFGDGPKAIVFGASFDRGILKRTQPDVEISEKQFAELMKSPVFREEYKDGSNGTIQRLIA